MVALRRHAESRDYDSIRSLFYDLDSVGNDPAPLALGCVVKTDDMILHAENC
jgi:hypothetical protein